MRIGITTTLLMSLLLLPVNPVFTSTASAATSVEVIGHRGFGAGATEQTVPAIKAAYNAGADGVEVDVRFSKDGIPFALHDTTVNRTTNCAGPISGKSASSLKTCGVATLDAITREVNKYPLRIYLHLKVCESDKQAKAIWNEVLNTGRTYFIGERSTQLVLMDKYASNHKLGQFIHSPSQWTNKWRVLIVYDTPASKSLVDKAHKAGHKVLAVEGHPVAVDHVTLLGLDGFVANDVPLAIDTLH